MAQVSTQNLQLAEHQIIDQFRAAMAAAGLKTDDTLNADGELQRFHVDGDPKGSRNGWYVLFTDGVPAGGFGCWKRGTNGSWSASSGDRLTPGESQALQQRIERARREREGRERERHEAVAAHAQQLWDDAREIDGQAHPYLERKGVDAYGLRIGEWPTGVSALLVPLRDATGKLWSLQAIFANKNPKLGRDKDFLAGGRKQSCFFSIGTPPTAGAGTVVLCEGYATGASVYRATGLFTVVAFDAYNLKAVAYALRRRWPACQLLIAADNDRWTVPTPERPHTVENPGVTFARQLQEAIPSRVLVAVPEFDNLDERPTDFNDLHRLQGLDAVRQQIMAVLPEPETPANDNEPDHLPLDANVSPFNFPHLSDKGQPLNTPENLAYLLGEYGITCRYNVISKDAEIQIPGREFSRDNRAAASLATITGLCARARMPRENMADYLQLIADANPHNPAAQWIESKPWDGTDRIHALAQTLDPSDLPLATMLLRRWLIGAAAAVYEPDGVSLQGVLVLQGAQNAGKTSWFWSLTNRNKALGLEGAQLNPSDRDSVKSVISYWLVELGELDATFRKADIAALKAFITRSQDELFLRYSRAMSSFPRRTAFFASVNEKSYLRDETGNRRYWTISCGAGLNAFHDVDMQQVWAQAAELYRQGEQWRLSNDEMNELNELNEDHREVSPVEELVRSRFDWSGDMITTPMTATDVLIAIGYDRPNTKQKQEAGVVLRKVTGRDPRKSNGRQVFDMPPLIGPGGAPVFDDEDRPF